jgi:hypothetical protein
MPAILGNNGVVVTCSAVDSAGNQAQCQETVNVVDTVAPPVGAETTYNIPCDNLHHTVTAADCGVSNIQDVCDGCAATATLVAVDVDEPCSCTAAVKDKTSTSVSLLGGQNAEGDGRVYLLKWSLTDKEGNSADQLCLVTVGTALNPSTPTYQC